MTKIHESVSFFHVMQHLSASEQKALDLFHQKISDRFHSRLVATRLFGSTVRGERQQYSDIDILILIEDLTAEEKRWIWDEANHINIEKDSILSPLVMTPEEFQKLRDRERRIALDIDHEGVSLLVSLRGTK